MCNFLLCSKKTHQGIQIRERRKTSEEDINNRMVLVDEGSSVNIILLDALTKMNIPQSEIIKRYLGGILCIWNHLVFQKHKVIYNDNFIVVEQVWLPTY